MTTFSDLQTTVAVALRDPSKTVFKTTDLQGMINMALAEIGRIAPRRFQEDITPSPNAMEYTILLGDFGAPVPEIEVTRVELWDGSQTPPMPVSRILPADGEYINYSQSGWKVWDGVLELPRYVPLAIVGRENQHLLRIWGYAPYEPLVNDADVVGLSHEREQALIARSRVEGLRRLNDERDLFTQWQAGANNSDVSPASLMNALSLASDDWRRIARSITVLREAAG